MVTMQTRSGQLATVHYRATINERGTVVVGPWAYLPQKATQNARIQWRAQYEQDAERRGAANLHRRMRAIRLHLDVNRAITHD